MNKGIVINNIMAACKTVFNRVTSYFSNPIILQSRKSLPYYQQNATIKLKELSKFGVPLPPKKPLGTFFRFRETVYPRLKAENPQSLPKDLLKLLSAEWAKYPSEKKELLKQEVLADLDIYKKDYENYKNSLSPEEVDKLKEAKLKKKADKQESARKKKADDLNKPVRPISAYALYFRDKVGTIQVDNHKEAMKTLADSWRAEAFDVKKKYKQQYDKLRFEYKSTLKEWEQKMIDLGHLDVIGTRALRKLHKEYKEKGKIPKKKQDS